MNAEQRDELARDYTLQVNGSLNQLARLLAVEPPLSKEEIGHRMALNKRETHRLFQLLRIKR